MGNRINIFAQSCSILEAKFGDDSLFESNISMFPHTEFKSGRQQRKSDEENRWSIRNVRRKK